MLETNDQFYAANELEKWYYQTNHQVIDLNGKVGTGKFEIIKYFIDRIGFKEYETMFLSLNQSTVINLAQKQYHSYYLKGILYDYYKDTDLSTLKIFNPKATDFKYKWIQTRNKKINKSYRIIIVLDAELCSMEMIQDLMKFGVPMILVSDSYSLGEENNYLKKHTPNLEIKEIIPSRIKDPIIHFIYKFLNKEVIPYGNFKSVTVMKKKDTNAYNFKFSDMIITEYQSSADKINQLYRQNVLKNKTIILRPNERLIITEDSHICSENRTEKNIKFYLDRGVTGTVPYVEPHFATRKFINVTFKPDAYTESFSGVIVDRFYLNNFTNRSISYSYGEPVKFNYAYAINAQIAQYGRWDDITVLEEPYEDYDFHLRVLYTAMSRAKKSIILIR